ncbi:hypothetical protein HYPSUDRAFT_48047 [Hypholoma sublateritium FD-334 SS-4]|uniref:Uncharacterized protein n=1 Tax=Hypholoma sublateritium (strain FD-334 SS-4) TaxID=945553 RepID=A0A0D2LY69_HYPSF|nr:hypothetical protein HYPSUDRAFT_48047 [Hypholoma sublateritium FD-334 SS-4]
MLFGSAHLQILRISIQVFFCALLFKILESMLNISPTGAPCTSFALHVKLIC